MPHRLKRLGVKLEKTLHQTACKLSEPQALRLA